MPVFCAVFSHSSYLSPWGEKRNILIEFQVKMKNTIVLGILRGMGFSIPPNSSYVIIPELSKLGTDPKYLCHSNAVTYGEDRKLTFLCMVCSRDWLGLLHISH